MSNPQRKVEKLNLDAKPKLEEQVWLAHAILILLTAYLAGITLAVFRFDAPNPLKNAAFLLFVLGVGYCAIAFCVTCYQSRWLRQGMFVCFLLSLVLNVSLLVILAFFNVLGAPKRVAVKTPEKEKQVDKLVEYDMSSQPGNEREKREYELPVEAGQPEISKENPIGKQVTSVMKSEELDVAKVEIETQMETQLPKPQRQLAQTVPRFSDLQGTISRQSIQSEPHASKPTPNPDKQSEAEKIVQLDESQAEIQRTQPEVAQKTLDQELDVKTDRPRELASISKQESEIGEPEIASAEPSLPRRVRSPLTLPNAAIPAASSEAIAQKVNDVLEPHTTIMQKQESFSPNQERKIDPILEVVQQPTARTINRNEDLPDSTDVAQATERSLARAILKRQPNSDQKVAEQTPVELSVDDEPLQPSTNSLAREKSSTQPSVAQLETELSEVLHPRITDAKIAKKRMPQPIEAATTDQISRSETTAKIPSTLTASNPVETINPVELPKSNVESAEPLTVSPLAVAKSIQGITGSRAEPNFAQDTRARTSLVQSSSTSAKRSNPTQEMQSGPALSPSNTPLIKRAHAGEPMPSSSMISQVEVGNVASGAKQPKQLDASSSSLQRTEASNAPISPTTAQVGESDVDLGPTRIVTNTGQARATGGGQPELNQQMPGTKLARSPLSESAVPSKTSLLAEAVVAPTASMSSQPSTTPLDAAETSVAQTAPSSSTVGESMEQPSESAPSQSRLATEPKLVSRSTAVDTRVSEIAKLGGGNQLASRTPRGRTVQLDNSAKLLELTGTDSSSGDEQAIPLAAQQAIPNRVGSGIPSLQTDELTGAFQDIKVFQGKSTGASESSIKRRSASPAETGRFAVADETGSGLPHRRATSTVLPSAVANPTIQEVPLAGTAASDNRDPISDQLAVASKLGPLHQSENGGLVVDLDASEGVGGLFLDPSPTVGIQRRRAVPESENIIDVPARFVRKQFGGPPIAAVKAKLATSAFQIRLNRKGKAPVGGATRPSPKTEAAIELGLVFLAKQQLPDGSWSLNVQGDGTPYPQKERALIRSDAAATGLALLSFMGAGYHHQDDKYQHHIHDALRFLIERQKDDGDLYSADDDHSNRSAWLYSHAIASIALCEAYGMTQDPWIKEPAQRALDFVIASQNQERGGWRYSPGVSSDTSVTGWMMMALRSGELSNLDVPKETFKNIEHWLERAQVSPEQSYQFRYNPFAADTEKQRHGRQETTTMTSVGLLMRLYSGWHRDRQEMIEGAEYLLKNLPKTGATNSIQRDTYYWYYATQVMFHMRGKYWQEWNDRLHPMLVESQIQIDENAGSWNPIVPVPDRWAPHGGRLYVTTMNLLSLEVYYRHLPIYVDTAK